MSLFNKTFFSFVGVFLGIIALSVGLIALTGFISNPKSAPATVAGVGATSP